MRDDRMGKVEKGTPDVERELGRLAASPVPPGLRRRVMERASETRGKALLPPGMRIVAVACPILIVALLTADPFLNRHGSTRLAAVVDGQVRPGPEAETSAVLAEVLGEIGEASEAARMARRVVIAEAAARKERERQVTEARKRLKGWLADEVLEDLI